MSTRDIAASCLVVLSLAITVGDAGGQSVPERGPAGVRNVISANPILLVFEWFNLEIEHRASTNSTIGIQGSTFRLSGDRYFSGRGFFRYYPSAAWDGFFAGVRAGITGVEDDGESETVLGVGVEFGIAWMLGSRRRFHVSIGAGADHLGGADSGGIPTLRLVNIGLSF